MSESIMQMMAGIRTNLDALGYKPPEDSPGLKAHIAAAQLRAMKNAEKVAWVLCNVADEPWHKIRKGNLHDAFLDALIAGDDAQFGILLAREVRRKVMEEAADEARGEYEELNRSAA